MVYFCLVWENKPLVPWALFSRVPYFFLQVCHAAVGLVGDICRSLGQVVTPFCDEIMTILLENLSNTEVSFWHLPPEFYEKSTCSAFGSYFITFVNHSLGFFSYLLFRNWESNSRQFSCTSLRDLNSGSFTDWATAAFMKEPCLLVNYLLGHNGYIEALSWACNSLTFSPLWVWEKSQFLVISVSTFQCLGAPDGEAAGAVGLWGHCPRPRARVQEISWRGSSDLDAGISGSGR